jgi:hypothetical protein
VVSLVSKLFRHPVLESVRRDERKKIIELIRLDLILWDLNREDQFFERVIQLIETRNQND